MATLGHVVFGMALGRLDAGPNRPPRALLATWVGLGALSLLPDIDTLGLLVGVGWDHPFAHRGATHSVLIALLAGAAVGAVQRARRRPARRTAGLVAAALAGHGLLDAMVDAGCGPALLWPLTDQRFWSPFRPIPWSPIGGHMLSRRGAFVLAYEALLFFPLLVFALRTRRDARSGVNAQGPCALR